MNEDEHPDLKGLTMMTPMQIVAAQMAELIEGLKAAGLPEKAAIRFAAIVFAEQSADDEGETDD